MGCCYMKKRFCTNCGAKYPEGAKFCPDCGEPLGETSHESSKIQESFTQLNELKNAVGSRVYDVAGQVDSPAGRSMGVLKKAYLWGGKTAGVSLAGTVIWFLAINTSFARYAGPMKVLTLDVEELSYGCALVSELYCLASVIILFKRKYALLPALGSACLLFVLSLFIFSQFTWSHSFGPGFYMMILAGIMLLVSGLRLLGDNAEQPLSVREIIREWIAYNKTGHTVLGVEIPGIVWSLLLWLIIMIPFFYAKPWTL